MTQNQIAFAKAVEEERHNRANETFDVYKHQDEMAYKVWEQYMKDASAAGTDAATAKSIFGRALAQGRRVSSLAQAAAQAHTMSAITPAWSSKLNERNAENNTATSTSRRSGLSSIATGRRFYE